MSYNLAYVVFYILPMFYCFFAFYKSFKASPFNDNLPKEAFKCVLYAVPLANLVFASMIFYDSQKVNKYKPITFARRKNDIDNSNNSDTVTMSKKAWFNEQYKEANSLLLNCNSNLRVLKTMASSDDCALNEICRKYEYALKELYLSVSNCDDLDKLKVINFKVGQINQRLVSYIEEVRINSFIKPSKEKLELNI